MGSIDLNLGVLESEELPLSNNTNLPPKLHQSTLSRRARGIIIPREQYRENLSLLTYNQQEFLVKYIDKLTKRGLPPNPHNVRIFASNICGKMPGKNWVSRFVNNHRDQLSSEYLAAFDLCRKKADNWFMINRYFNMIEEKFKKHEYRQENVYNMDEKGFLIGVVNKTRRIFTRSWKEQGKLKGAAQDGNRTWVTLLACVCADGTSLPPTLIYPSESSEILDSWLDDYDPADGTYFTASPTGWTNNEISLQWLMRLFDRHTKQKARQGRDPRLLIVDGHGSHLNMDFVDWCDLHNIHLCAFPPHTTHRLQPLDVSLFSPLSTYYSQELDRWLQATEGLTTMSKIKFYSLFKEAFTKAFTEANIASGWRKTGLFPFNPPEVLDQLSTRSKPPEERPGSGSSAGKSVLSMDDWKRVNTMMREAVGGAMTYEWREVMKAFQRNQASMAMMKLELEGVKEALRAEKQKKKPRKKIFAQLRSEEDGNALFLSPAKISMARELEAQKKSEIEAGQARKEQQRLEKSQLREQQAEKRKAAAAARQERKEQLAKSKAEKEAQKEEALTQRLASLQLTMEQQAVGANPKRKSRKTQHHTAQVVDQISHMEEPEASEAVMPTSRSGRQLRKPRRLDDFEF
jgi:hypothetical protein